MVLEEMFLLPKTSLINEKNLLKRKVSRMDATGLPETWLKKRKVIISNITMNHS